MCYLNKHFKGGNSIWEDTNSMYSLIDSFNTYPSRSMPVPGSLLGTGVQGPVCILFTILSPFRANCFSDKSITLPNFSSLLWNYISREKLVHERKLTLLQPLGKASVLAKYHTKGGSSECFIITRCSTFPFLLFLQEYSDSILLIAPPCPPPPYPRILTWPSSPLQERAGHPAPQRALSSIPVLLYLREKSVRCFKVYLASVLMSKK